MKALDGRFCGLVIVTLLVAACIADLPTAAEPARLVAAKGGNGSGSPGYTVVDLGALLGATITDTRVRPEDSHALGVSDAGATAGFLEGPLHSLASTAFLWRGSELLSLKPPKSGKEGKAWAISPSGEFLAGEAIVGASRHAVRWTILSP